MKLEIETISNENIKPSCPTPHDQQTYKLSMLDQIVPPILVPIVLYFPASSSSTKIAPSILKNSLSLLLTRFYVLAGRTKEDCLSIDCNDEGVPFTVANIKGHKLSDLLKNPDPELPRFLLPCEGAWGMGPGSSVVRIQVNCFDCGGIAIGAVFWHKTADGATMANFMSSWADTTRGSIDVEPVYPNYDAQYLFPQKQELANKSDSYEEFMKTGKTIMRRYEFNASAISKLKAESNVDRPTRVEVVSSLIWKCFMAASIANNHKASLVTHAVNLRTKAQPPLPSHCFGNYIGLVAATTTNQNEIDFGHLVRKTRDAIRKIDGDYINRMRGENGLLGHYENLGRIWSEVPKETDLLPITSWCGFDFYSSDFGWGKPVWITRFDVGNELESPFFNGVWLIDTRDGDGVEAWVILEEKYMDIFDNVEDLRNIASRDPSPLLDTAFSTQT